MKIRLRFRPLSSARSRPAIAAAIAVSIAFVAGAVYFYKVPAGVLWTYFIKLVVFSLIIIVLALIFAGVFVMLRKFWGR